LHTLAHALESVTGYEYFRHGEAVGYGILFAAELSENLALCGKTDVQLLNDVVLSVGPLPALGGIDENEVRKAFTLDKKNVAGSLQMVLLKGIGKPVIVSEQDIPQNVMTKTLTEFLAKWA
jgi:3-dehydroquinate synthase